MVEEHSIWDNDLRIEIKILVNFVLVSKLVFTMKKLTQFKKRHARLKKANMRFFVFFERPCQKYVSACQAGNWAVSSCSFDIAIWDFPNILWFPTTQSLKLFGNLRQLLQKAFRGPFIKHVRGGEGEAAEGYCSGSMIILQNSKRQKIFENCLDAKKFLGHFWHIVPPNNSLILYVCPWEIFSISSRSWRSLNIGKRVSLIALRRDTFLYLFSPLVNLSFDIYTK